MSLVIAVIAAFLIGSGLGQLAWAIGWHLRLRKALRFIQSCGTCRTEDLPVEFKYLTASKLGERNWVYSEWEVGRLELTPIGEKVIR